MNSILFLFLFLFSKFFSFSFYWNLKLGHGSHMSYITVIVTGLCDIEKNVKGSGINNVI